MDTKKKKDNNVNQGKREIGRQTEKKRRKIRGLKIDKSGRERDEKQKTKVKKG